MVRTPYRRARKGRALAPRDSGRPSGEPKEVPACRHHVPIGAAGVNWPSPSPIDGRQHREIAEAAGIAPQTLSGILSGRIRDPRPRPVPAIADALGRREDEIFPEYASTDVVIDDDLAAKVRAQRIAQGLPPELTDEQMDFIGAVVFSDLRGRKVAANK